jgi:hypothetical protein
VDRAAIARAVRRRQAQEALDFERDREKTLEEQIELVIGEAEGRKIDAGVFAQMSPEDVEIVREELDPTPHADTDDEGGGFFERDDLSDGFTFGEASDPSEEELKRLAEELESCRRRQRAFEAYLAALGD